MGIGDWGLGIGDWGLGPIPNPQTPNPQPPTPQFFLTLINIYNKIFLNLSNKIYNKIKNINILL